MIKIIASNAAIRALILVAIFVIVALIASAAVAALNRRFEVRAQLQSLRTQMPGNLVRTASLRSRENDSAWTRLAAAVEAAGLNLTDTKSERLTVKLRAAGYTSADAPRVFTLVRLAMMFILPASYLALAYSSAQPPSFIELYAIGVGLATLGLYIPNLYVQAKADRRQQEIINGFPDSLDLMLVCVESGLGIEAAMDRVGREMVRSHPLVAELLSVVTLQMRAGASREEAYRKMADAASVDDIRSFATLLIQSDKLGSSISSTLRVYAAEMREKRRMRAEERAHRLPVLLSIPLVACMLPTMIGVLMLPAVVMVVRAVIPMMRGG